MLVHLDTDFLIHALGRSGTERQRLLRISDTPAEIQMSAIAWYEFVRARVRPSNSQWQIVS